jgi:hypothetical protein
MPVDFWGTNHSGTLIQGLFLPGAAVVDNTVRSSAVCAGDFSREDGRRETKLISDLDAACSRGVELASRDVEPLEWF